MNLLVQVKDGNIEVVEARSGGDRGLETHRFAGDGEAVDFVAGRVAETACPVAFHHSCTLPDAHGRPGFFKQGFVADLQDAIYRIQSRSRMAA